ncbi:expressed protein [Chlorella variabilis]|uniref:Expressed protein n=1 Tax=Chlorella variabilis TaxID=554065 RepID=E1ZKM2_CHLVA|nr:expressed protein [Chlorella variabilis]EFN53717.1 expressed protein [Chlorella variabilis]|eukprot:XP_005845819.1 expressed protein [Chlorella variabilis]
MPTRIQDSHVVQLVPSLVLGLLLNTLLALPLRALRGLRCYYVAVGAPSGSKRVKARRGKKDDDIDLGGAEALVLAPLSAQQAAQLTYRGSFENLFIVGLFALSSTAAAEVAEQLLGWPGSAWPSMLAFGLTVVALTMLAQVDLLSSTTSPSNKALAVFWGLGGFAAALALHVLQPAGSNVLAWDTQRAAAAVGPTVQEAIKALGSRELKEGTAPIPLIAITASTLQVGLALAAAVVSVLLYAPALRFVHSFWLQLNPPEWASDYIAPGALMTASLHFQLLLPLLSSLLWVRPMCQELLDLSDQQLAFMQAGALLCWHQLKHGSLAARAKRDDKKSLGDLIRASCQAIHFLLGKAGVQLLAPAALYLGLGLLLLNSALHPGSPGSMAAETQVLVQTCVGFVAAWSGGCWFVYSAVLLFFFRTGVLSPF